MIKKIAVLFLSFVLALGLAACGNTGGSSSSQSTNQQSSSLSLRVTSTAPDDESSAVETNEPNSTEEYTAPVFNFETKMVRLNSGYDMPILGLGTWALDDEAAENSVYHALLDGYRLIDTATYYDNSVGVGRGIKRSGVPREEIFVTTKLYMDEYADAESVINKELEELDLDYIDLLLLHHPDDNDVEAYKVMEKAVQEGKVRSIGISNYYEKEFDEFIQQVTIMPAVVQNEVHIYYQENDLREHFEQHGVVLEAWYPFGGRGRTQELFNNETIVEIASAHNKSSAQIILRWDLQKGVIAIPGSSNPDHIQENFEIFDFQLSDAEMEKINALDRNEKFGWY